MGLLAAIIDPKRESRSGLANPAQWLIDALGGDPSGSGISVTEMSALKFTAVYASVRIIAETMASLPYFVFQRGDGDARRRAMEQPAYKLLHDQANPHMTAMVFRETVQGHVLTHGNGYAEIARDGSGNPGALWPLDPSRVGPALNSDGELEYVYKPSTGSDKRIPAKDVLHIPGLGFDGYVGYSPIRLAREAIGLGLAAERHGASFFANDSRPSGILEHPGKMETAARDRLHASWEAIHSQDSAHRMAILEQGMTWKAVGIPNEDAQWLESRAFQIRDIARIYRIPPHLLADLDRATFSNIEAQGIEFVTHCIRPWLVRWEQECNRKLVKPGSGYFCEHIVDALLRGDTPSRYSAYSIGRMGGWLSANEIRRLENMNPIDGGDEYLVPLNMTPAAQQRAALEAHRPLLTDVCGRILRREAGAIESALRHEDTWAAEVEGFYGSHGNFIRQALEPALTACLAAMPMRARTAGAYAQCFAELRIRAAGRSAPNPDKAREAIIDLRDGAAAAWADEILIELIGGDNTNG